MSRIRLFNFLGSYNKAYKNVTVPDLHLDTFINSIKNFYNNTTNLSCTEETLKAVFNSCVLTRYNAVPNINRTDLSITKNGVTQVIFEFKMPSNHAEMLQIGNENINKKALQETIWYFYNQESLEVTYQIKNLVITDTEHFFFFNPKAFCNNDLKKICLAFKDKQLAFSDTKTLYKEIGNIIENHDIKFDYAEFDLSIFKNKIINNILTDADKKQLTYFYKALHPDFLLRNFRYQDSNELNQEFYKELLYILGISEIEKNSKKLLEPSTETGTFRDLIYENLDEITNSKERFEIAIQLIIIWLNRILFLKLFEGQLISFNGNDKSYAFFNSDKISTFNNLNQLFFNVLGKPLFERSISSQFTKIPYLNSTLFELSEIEQKYNLKISGLNQDSEMIVKSDSVLKKSGHCPLKLNALKYLLDFLERYDFTSKISPNNKEIIGSSVLGLIFEKLNGYQDGSYFTPGTVTENMVKTAIDAIVVERFNREAFPDYEPCETIEELAFLTRKNAHTKKWNKIYNDIFNNIHICDPAVGSGHFLVSALNYMVYIKSFLGILPISNPIEIQNDNLVVYDAIEQDEQFHYLRSNKKSLEIQKALFDEKKNIIENCLFGVDINPNSVNICQLRLWIELLKNTYYIANSNEMEILPNIDINIKCSNSLKTILPIKVGSAVTTNTLDENQIYTDVHEQDIKTYKTLARKYKSAKSKVEKKDAKQQLKIIKQKLTNTTLFMSSNSYDSTEWMIEFPELLDKNGKFIGFDIVCGNPPYGVKLSNDDKKLFKEEYDSAKTIKNVQKGSLDTYSLFIERGLSLLKKQGVLTFIVPMGITCSDSMTGLHKIMFAKCKKITISSYAVRPQPVFESAVVNTSIITLYYTGTPCDTLLSTKMHRKSEEDNLQSVIDNLEYTDVRNMVLRGRIPKIGKEIEKNILNKVLAHQPLKNYIDPNGLPIYYRFAGGRYFKVITNYPNHVSSEKPIYLKKDLANSIGCILSSNLSFWFYQIYSDNLNWKTYEIENFRIPSMQKTDVEYLSKLYEEYLLDIEHNAEIRTVSESSSYTVDQFKNYRIGKSKAIIDEIDNYIGKLYGLTEEEISFINNYEIKFRLSGADE